MTWTSEIFIVGDTDLLLAVVVGAARRFKVEFMML